MATGNNNLITLCLELSQRNGSVAMSNKSGNVMEIKVDSGRRESDDVLPALEELSTKLGVLPNTIDLVVVSIGPGGFTGLRSAISIAKLISFGSGASVLPVETAISVANNANLGNGPFCVVSGVKQDSFWASFVNRDQDVWVCDAFLSNITEICTKIDSSTTVFGDSYLPQPFIEICDSKNIKIVETTTSASSLLNLGLDIYKSDSYSTIVPNKLLPLYPREPEAVRVWKENRSTK